VKRLVKTISGLIAAAAVILATSAEAQEAKHYRFAHDQQLNTGYSVAYDIFSARLKELSKGTMLIDQYPGAQLGQEPQLLQLVKAGDIEFAIVSSANTATISPQAGVMSLHFLFRNADHVVKALADKQVIDAIKTMIDETTQGLHVIATGSQGVRNIYSKKEVHNVGDLKGIKIRVQATATEDAIFPAYGAQTVHMPFGSVYTSLQTGVVAAAEKVGDDGGGRCQRQGAGEGVRAREVSGHQAEVTWRQDRRGRGQEELCHDRRPLSRQACQGARPARGKDQGADPGDQLGRRPAMSHESSRRKPGPIRRGLSVGRSGSHLL
jgi:hypothetical protein